MCCAEASTLMNQGCMPLHRSCCAQLRCAGCGCTAPVHSPKPPRGMGAHLHGACTHAVHGLGAVRLQCIRCCSAFGASEGAPSSDALAAICRAPVRLSHSCGVGARLLMHARTHAAQEGALRLHCIGRVSLRGNRRDARAAAASSLLLTCSHIVCFCKEVAVQHAEAHQGPLGLPQASCTESSLVQSSFFPPAP